MKKLIPIVIALLLLECMYISTYGQLRSNKEQLYCMSKEVIKADMKEEYIQARQELISVCEETSFPYSFILWSSKENHCHLWYPIEELNDIDRINKAWDAFEKEYGNDIFKPIQECIETSISQVMLAYRDLAYEPPESRLQDDETHFCRMKKLYLNRGSEKEVKALVKKVIELYESKGVTSAFYFGEGEIGFETPVLFNWSFARDLNDYLQQGAKIKELLGADYQEINHEISHHVRETETIDFRYMNNMSYNYY